MSTELRVCAACQDAARICDVHRDTVPKYDSAELNGFRRAYELSAKAIRRSCRHLSAPTSGADELLRECRGRLILEGYHGDPLIKRIDAHLSAPPADGLVDATYHAIEMADAVNRHLVTQDSRAAPPSAPDGLVGKLSHEELFAALYDLGWRIEACGASIELTNAVTLCSDIRRAVGNKWNPADQQAAERVLSRKELSMPQGKRDTDGPQSDPHGTLRTPETSNRQSSSAAPAAESANENGWLIENGKDAPHTLYRYIEQGLPAWTPDVNKAIRFARRADAEMYAAEDEDAWRIAEHLWHNKATLAASQGGDGGK